MIPLTVGTCHKGRGMFVSWRVSSFEHGSLVSSSSHESDLPASSVADTLPEAVEILHGRARPRLEAVSFTSPLNGFARCGGVGQASPAGVAYASGGRRGELPPPEVARTRNRPT